MAIERARQARSCFRYASDWIIDVSCSIFASSSSFRCPGMVRCFISEFRFSMVLPSLPLLYLPVLHLVPNHEEGGHGA